MKKPIFVSYSRKDKEIVYQLVDKIGNEIGKNNIWIDLSGIKSGDEISDTIREAIDDSIIVMFMLSDNSIASEYVRKEVKYGKHTNKKIIPVILDGKGLRNWFLFDFEDINFTDIRDEDQVNQLINTLKQETRKSIKKKYLDLAKNYLEKNPKANRYCVTYVCQDDDMELYRYISLNEHEKKCIDHLTNELGYTLSEITQEYGEEIDSASFEGFDAQYEDALKYVAKELETDDEYWPDSIDLDNSTKFYKFKQAIFLNGLDEKPEVYYFNAQVTDDDYIKLLALKMENRSLTFNKLRNELPECFNYLSYQAEESYDVFFSPSEPYAIEMTEVEEDVFKIVGEESAYKEIYRQNIETEDLSDTTKTRHTFVNIIEKVLSFDMEDVDSWINGDREYIDVDAIIVEKAMGVENYKGIIDRLEKDFGGPNGVQKFRKWLDENSIPHKFNESHDI